MNLCKKIKFILCEAGYLRAPRFFDNRIVIIAFNFYKTTSAKVERQLKDQKKVDFAQPAVIADYNAHMGGVDIWDGYLNN